MAYVDEALKLDARALMAVAMQTGRQGSYGVRLSRPTGYIMCGDLRENPDRVVSAYITVKWPTRAGNPASGDVLVGYCLGGDQPAAQTVTLTGTPAQVGGWLWRFTCPETEQQVQAVYLAPGGGSFVSREAAGLKDRRTTPADRYQRRCLKLMHKLKADHLGPGIGKPPGMSDRTFDKLDWQLTKAHTRYLHAVLGKPAPDFPDEEPAPAKRAPPPALPRASRFNPSSYFRDKSGALKLRAKFKTKFAM
jgi:hypothetical protein